MVPGSHVGVGWVGDDLQGHMYTQVGVDESVRWATAGEWMQPEGATPSLSAQEGSMVTSLGSEASGQAISSQRSCSVIHSQPPSCQTTALKCKVDDPASPPVQHLGCLWFLCGGSKLPMKPYVHARSGGIAWEKGIATLASDMRCEASLPPCSAQRIPAWAVPHLLAAMGNAHMGHLRGLPQVISLVKRCLHMDLHPSGFLAPTRGAVTHTWKIYAESGWIYFVSSFHDPMVDSRAMRMPRTGALMSFLSVDDHFDVACPTVQATPSPGAAPRHHTWPCSRPLDTSARHKWPAAALQQSCSTSRACSA